VPDVLLIIVGVAARGLGFCDPPGAFAAGLAGRLDNPSFRVSLPMSPLKYTIIRSISKSEIGAILNRDGPWASGFLLAV
jgi:hypothetical protein